jgi:hypothetical protein
MAENSPANTYKFDPNALGGLSNVNLTDSTTQDVQDIRDALKKYQDQLEHRYDNPNWFGVAAGFLKPQLGGFGASLGSASQALGENVENKRAAQMQAAQVGLNATILDKQYGKRFKQNEMWQEIKKKGSATPQEINSLIALDANSDIAKTVANWYKPFQEQTNVVTDQAKLASQYPQLKSAMEDAIQKAADPNASPEDRKKRIDDANKALSDSKPVNVPDQTWNALNDNQKRDFLYNYQKDASTIGMTEQQKSAAKAKYASDYLASLGLLRDYALGKGLKPVEVPDGKGGKTSIDGQEQMNRALGVFQGGNLFDVMGKAFSEGQGPEFMKGLDQKFVQLNVPEQARIRVQEMAKEIAKHSVETRNASVNPTNALQTLQQNSFPQLGNSQQAFVGMLDTMAHATHKDINEHRFKDLHGIDYNDPYAKPDQADMYAKFMTNYGKAHAKNAAENPTYDTPKYYNSSYVHDYSDEAGIKPSAAPAAPAASAGTPSGKTAAQSNKRLSVAELREIANRSKQP